MSKITIKRYLNKKLKPITVYDDVDKGYFIYYSITYNRKTQNIKSICGAVMTEKAFNILEKENSLYNFEINYTNVCNGFSIIEEFEYLHKIVETIVKKYPDINIFDSFFTPLVKSFFDSLKDKLYNIAWQKDSYDFLLNDKNDTKNEYSVSDILDLKLYMNELDNSVYSKFSNFEHPEYERKQFYNSLNRSNNLIFNIECLSRISRINFKDYVLNSTLNMWHLINSIISFYGDKPKIVFILDLNHQKYYEDLLSKGIDCTEKEIILYCNYLENRLLAFDF